jgi:hypothetical protein
MRVSHIIWIVDLDDPVTLIDCHLAGEFGYQDPSPVTSRFVTTEPFLLICSWTAFSRAEERRRDEHMTAPGG